MNTNNLPPLPKLPLPNAISGRHTVYGDDQIKSFASEYGQLCRQQALEEAKEDQQRSNARIKELERRLYGDKPHGPGICC